MPAYKYKSTPTASTETTQPPNDMNLRAQAERMASISAAQAPEHRAIRSGVPPSQPTQRFIPQVQQQQYPGVRTENYSRNMLVGQAHAQVLSGYTADPYAPYQQPNAPQLPPLPSSAPQPAPLPSYVPLAAPCRERLLDKRVAKDVDDLIEGFEADTTSDVKELLTTISQQLRNIGYLLTAILTVIIMYVLFCSLNTLRLPKIKILSTLSSK